MRDDYVPNEKYRNMFGVERNGYGCERVDLYLAQLEVAFKKIREDNRGLKRGLADQAAARPAAGLAEAGQQQELFIAQLQGQLTEEQEQCRRLHEQLVQEQEQGRRMLAQLAEEQEQNRRLLAQLGDISAGQLAAAAAQPSAATQALLAQLNALRAEADELRQQLRRQPQAVYPAPPMAEEDRHSLIGKVLVQAREQAEETLRAAQQEAEQITRSTRKRLEELRAEHDRIYSQLQGISYTLRNVLRDTGDMEYKRGEEFAAS